MTTSLPATAAAAASMERPVRRKNPLLTESQVRARKAKTDFIWQNTAEPHAERKTRILKAHGKQINDLMGYEWKTKYIALTVCALQLFFAILVMSGHKIHVSVLVQRSLSHTPVLSAVMYPFLGEAYLAPNGGLLSQALQLVRGSGAASWAAYCSVAFIFGGTFQHNLFLAVHEITHNLAFRRPIHNDILSIITNIGIGVPYSMMFKLYHAEHHRYQGWDGIDTDVPSDLETKLFNHTLGKLFFAFFQILFYAFRPGMIRKQKLTHMHALNWIIVLGFWIGIVGGGLGWGVLQSGWFYCALSTFFAGAMHPMSGHFISEHYIFDPEGVQETYSYYGPLNILGYNVGYHNEHHDFPNVPWSRLANVSKIAPEYYDHLIVTDSWPMTIWNFITDDRISVFSRVKREKDAWKRANLMPTEPNLAPAVYASTETTPPSTPAITGAAKKALLRDAIPKVAIVPPAAPAATIAKSNKKKKSGKSPLTPLSPAYVQAANHRARSLDKTKKK